MGFKPNKPTDPAFRELPPEQCPIDPTHKMTRSHCQSKNCTWYRCAECNIDFDTKQGRWKPGGH